MAIRYIVTWPIRSTRQFLANIRSATGGFKLEDFFPPWVWQRFWSTLNWIKAQLPRAAGYRSTPTEQMTASVVLAVTMILVSIGALTPLSAIMIIPFVIGFARLHPTVDRVWPLSKSNSGGSY